MYDNIISLKNLHIAWNEFLPGKKNKPDVAEFALNLGENICMLHNDLRNKTYRHGSYKHFKISDPKPRDIHKASVRDRLLHHAIHRVLYPFFDPKFISDSYSCREGKGVHKALDRFRDFGRSASFNHTKTVYVLKCDIRKFFASIDHSILIKILEKHIADTDILRLLENVTHSFHTSEGKGLPLGNLTSQLLVNIYMNEFDQFVKHKLKVKYYIRYADDFVIFSQDKRYLSERLRKMGDFLSNDLYLSLHPDKVYIRTLASSVDFLGWVHFPTHRVLRTVTKRRMFMRVNEKNVSSYLGLCKHGNTYKIGARVRRLIEDVIQ